MDRYITKDGKKLRLGYTTGSCAAAAAKAAAIMLLSRKKLDTVCLITPGGMEFTLEVCDIAVSETSVKCAIRKDGGDDPDVTHGMLIYACVEKISEKDIIIDGGGGIGRVTKPGLDQPCGNAAINSTPRKMITRELSDVRGDYAFDGGFSVVISAPEGEKIAERTFNRRLGITGGISILGTSGIVEPMSDSAVIDTVKTELNMRRAGGETLLVLTPGNYGESYIGDTLRLDVDRIVKCSNFIGDAFEYAAETGYDRILLVGHIGKLIKLAGGLFNTHSRMGDCRAEIMAAHAALFGLDPARAARIMDAATVDEMIAAADELGIRENVMKSILAKTEFLISERIRTINSKIETAVVMFSLKYGLLCMSDNAAEMIETDRADKNNNDNNEEIKKEIPYGEA